MIMFFAVTAGGLAAVDLNKSYVLYGYQEFEMIKVDEVEKDIYQLSIFNEKFSLNFKYLRRDFDRIRNFFNKV
jgi:hypothetical protein